MLASIMPQIEEFVDRA